MIICPRLFLWSAPRPVECVHLLGRGQPTVADDGRTASQITGYRGTAAPRPGKRAPPDMTLVVPVLAVLARLAMLASRAHPGVEDEVVSLVTRVCPGEEAAATKFGCSQNCPPAASSCAAVT